MDVIGLGFVSLMTGWVLGIGCMAYINNQDRGVEIEEEDSLDGIQILDWRERA